MSTFLLEDVTSPPGGGGSSPASGPRLSHPWLLAPASFTRLPTAAPWVPAPHPGYGADRSHLCQDDRGSLAASLPAPLHPPRYATYIHPRGGGRHPVPGTRRSRKGTLELAFCLELPRTRKALHVLSPLHRARGSCSWKSVRWSSMWGRGRGAALPLPEEGTPAARGWPPSWLAAAQRRPSGWVPHAPGSGRCRCTQGGPS